MSNKEYVEIALSLTWLVVVPLYVIPYSGSLGGYVEHFMWVGFFPLFLYWGRRFWIRRWF